MIWGNFLTDISVIGGPFSPAIISSS